MPTPQKPPPRIADYLDELQLDMLAERLEQVTNAGGHGSVKIVLRGNSPPLIVVEMSYNLPPFMAVKERYSNLIPEKGLTEKMLPIGQPNS